MALKSKTFLRRAERDDLDTIVAWMEDPDFLEFLYGDPTRSPKQIREQIVSMLDKGETHCGLIANRVGCGEVHVYTPRRKWRLENGKR